MPKNIRFGTEQRFFFAEKIDADDYKITKIECKKRIEELEEELTRQMAEQKSLNIKNRLDLALKALTHISILYKNGDIETKRSVIGSIYPEKLEFDGSIYRTKRISAIANSIFLINSNLINKKNRTNELFSHLFGFVAKTGVYCLI